MIKKKIMLISIIILAIIFLLGIGVGLADIRVHKNCNSCGEDYCTIRDGTFYIYNHLTNTWYTVPKEILM